MLYTASRSAAASLRGIVIDVTAAGGGPFAPSAELEGALTARRIGWRQFERGYTDAMRTLYTQDRALWVDLVEQAAVMDVTLVGEAEGDEGTVWCARRLLYDMLMAVAADRGLMLDPDTGSLDEALLEIRRREVLAAEGTPLICPVCRGPADTARPSPTGFGEYGFCSQACQDKHWTDWRREEERKNYSSGRRP